MARPKRDGSAASVRAARDVGLPGGDQGASGIVELKNIETDVLILGAGIAGVSAAEELAGGDLRICLVDGEPRLPYKRTKISKHIATGFGAEEFALKPHVWYERNEIALLTGSMLVDLDLSARKASLASGLEVAFEQLLLASGSEPNRIPTDATEDDSKVFVVHSQTQVEAIIARTHAPEAILVVGGGVLGVEVAEQMFKRGHDVTLACSGSQLMPRQLDDASSRIVTESYQAAGVELFFGERIDSIESNQTGIRVELSGQEREFKRVIVCTGLAPNTELPARAGVEVRRGVVVDNELRCSLPGVYAAGDIAEHPDGTITRLCHAAEHQGRVAAHNILGRGRTDTLPPFRLKCEVFDHFYFSLLPPSDGQYESETPSGNRYRRFWYSGGRLSGAIMVDDENPKLYQRAVSERWSRSRVMQDLMG